MSEQKTNILNGAIISNDAIDIIKWWQSYSNPDESPLAGRIQDLNSIIDQIVEPDYLSNVSAEQKLESVLTIRLTIKELRTFMKEGGCLRL